MSNERIQNLLDSASGGPNPLFAKAVFGFLNAEGDSAYFSTDRRLEAGSRPVSRESIFDVASITKAFLTVLCHVLREKTEKFDNDARVAGTLEMRGAFTEHLTVGHLLQFCAQFTEGGYPTQDIIARKKGGGVSGLLEALRTCGLCKEPGLEWTYGNPHSILLGVFLERVMGAPLEVLMNEHLFGPLGMGSTMLRPVSKLHKVVRSHPDIPPGTIHDPTARIALQEGRAIGSAGYFSSAEDLLGFAGMILNRGMRGQDRILSEETATSLHRGILPKFGNGFGKWNEFRKNLRPEPFADDSALHKLGHTGCIVFVSPRHGACGAVLTDFLMASSGDGKDRRRLYELFAQLATSAGLHRFEA